MRLRKRLRIGSALVVVGAMFWLLHSVLLIAGAVILLLGGIEDMTDVTPTVLFATSLVAAVAAATLGAFLFCAGLVVYQSGTSSLTWSDRASGETQGLSQGTRTKANTGAFFVAVYGILGVATLVALAWPVADTSSLGDSSVLGALLAAVVWWISASVVFVLGTASVSSFFASIQKDLASPTSVSGTGLLTYSIFNATGTLILAGALVVAVLNAGPPSSQLQLAIAFGGAIEFLLAPILGTVVFGSLMVYGVRLGRIPRTA
jgi:hypothetical protein